MRALLPLALLALAGCAAPAPESTPTQPTAGPGEGSPFAIASAAFANGAPIPRKHTCDGDNVSPPLEITGLPSGTRTAALIVFDPDAPIPQAPARNVTHWLAWNLTAQNGAIAFPEGGVPAGAVQGANVGGEPRYAGPCPPQASTAHRYVFTAFALDAMVDLEENASRSDLEAAIAGHDLASATHTGTYVRALVG